MPSVWPLGSVQGRIGRGVAPQLVTARAIPGDGPALVDPTIWSVADATATTVVASGTIDGKPTVDVYDIDAGTRVWRAPCVAPVVGVTGNVILCGDDKGVAALDWFGKPGWTTALPFVAMDGSRVIVGEGSVRSAETGTELLAVALPAGARALAACEGELFAVLADRRFARFTTKLEWGLALAKTDTIVSIDACDATILATVAGEHGTALVAISRAGKLLGRIDDVRGMWPARDDPHAIEVATSTAVTRWDRALSLGQPLELPVLGAAIARRGGRRLVRATPTTAVLLDRHGIRAYVPLAATSAALGDDHILAGLRWFTIPRPWQGELRTIRSHPLMIPAELRDLPPLVTAVANSPTLKLGTKLVAIALFGSRLYAATDAGIAQLDVSTLAWGWHTDINDIRAIAATTEIVVVATATSILGFTPAGVLRWQHAGGGTIELAGDAVLVGGTTVLDSATGTVVATLPTTHATVLAFDETTLVISYEANRIVARAPAARMLPVWSVEVAGVVTSLQRAGHGVLVGLDDGDAYRLDAHTGEAVAVAGIGLVWRAVGDTITGEASGGPVPGVIVPPKIRPEIYKPTDLEIAAAIATPWPPPPPMPASWQLTIYDRGGGMRTRNDYALTSPTPAFRVGPAPFVYISGLEALVLDPVHGDPLRRVALPETGLAFSTIVDGRAVVGTILAAPLRAVVF